MIDALEDIWDAINRLKERLRIMEASQAQNQASIDAEKVAVEALGPKLDRIRVAVDALKNASSSGQALDFTGLDKAVQAIGSQADADEVDAQPSTTPPTGNPTPAGSNPNPPAPAGSGTGNPPAPSSTGP